MNIPRKKIAAIITEYRPVSHADVIIGKILEGYQYRHEDYPNLEVASMYVNQFPKRDMSRDLAKRYGFPIYDTIEGALTMGGKKLAVDGVLLIGEHGQYPHNEKGQHLYPRRRFFQETTDVFERLGQTVPVFNDKHLSFSWTNAKWMMDKARQLQFPFMAGSSLPVAFRNPALQLPRGIEVEQAIQIGFGGSEAYGFHALEALQCMVERRKGGETGVKSVQAIAGDAMWQAFDEGGWSKEVLEAALAKVPHHHRGDYRALTAKPRSGGAIFFLEYVDGLRAAVPIMDGWVTSTNLDGSAFTFACKVKGRAKPLATQFYLQEPFPFIHFAYLLKAIDYMIQTGQPAYPAERTLLTTGTLDAAMTSLYEKGKRFDTPHLGIAYQPADWPFATDALPKTFQRS